MELRPMTKTVKTPAENFTGDVYLNPVFNDDDAPLVVGLVRFTPGARTNWHSHANGQLLVCTDGVGLVACRDGTTIRLRAGESVWTPPGQEHWHGGTADTMMCHYAIQLGLERQRRSASSRRAPGCTSPGCSPRANATSAPSPPRSDSPSPP